MFIGTNGHVARALTIAGSDSGGGAGIQADLKTMHQFGVFGTSAITAVTAQNTVGVQGIHSIDAAFVRKQMLSIFDDIGADAVKTGMLPNAEIIQVVASVLAERNNNHLVVDPVMVAKGGQKLVIDSAIDSMRTHLIPLAEVVTPNIPEAGVLTEMELVSWESYHEAARRIAALGASAVIVKGGHADSHVVSEAPWSHKISASDSVDLLYHNGQFTYFITPRIDSKKTHGTGCTFSAAITSLLAKGWSLLDAVGTAKAFIYHAIESARLWDVGAGHGPTNHTAEMISSTSFDIGGVYYFDTKTWLRIE